MGCCSSNLKLDMNRTLDTSIYGSSKRSRSGSRSSSSSSCHSAATQCGTLSNSSSNNSSGVGSSACSTPQRSSSTRSSSNRSIWSRRSQTVRPICDDFAEQPPTELERSCGYHTCSSAASTPSKNVQLRRTQDMDLNETKSEADELEPAVGNLEWEMYMMQHAQRIMPKTSSPISQRRDATFDSNSRSYHKWRNYLQSTPAHMLHNVSHIPEAIAGHFCPTDFPAFSDLEEMESAAKRFKVDRGEHEQQQQQQSQLAYPFQLQQLTHTISTDL